MARMKKGKTTRIYLEGGPLAGGSILMSDPASGTLTFTSKGQTGRYGSFVGGNKLYWEPKNG